jgi:uncharacterized membrane protein
VVCEYDLVLQVKIFCLVIGVMEEQRVAIKFCVKAGKSAVETIELINKVYGSSAIFVLLCINEMHGSRRKILIKKSRQAALRGGT